MFGFLFGKGSKGSKDAPAAENDAATKELQELKSIGNAVRKMDGFFGEAASFVNQKKIHNINDLTIEEYAEILEKKRNLHYSVIRMHGRIVVDNLVPFFIRTMGMAQSGIRMAWSHVHRELGHSKYTYERMPDLLDQHFRGRVDQIDNYVMSEEKKERLRKALIGYKEALVPLLAATKEEVERAEIFVLAVMKEALSRIDTSQPLKFRDILYFETKFAHLLRSRQEAIGKLIMEKKPLFAQHSEVLTSLLLNVKLKKGAEINPSTRMRPDLVTRQVSDYNLIENTFVTMANLMDNALAKGVLEEAQGAFSDLHRELNYLVGEKCLEPFSAQDVKPILTKEEELAVARQFLIEKALERQEGGDVLEMENKARAILGMSVN